MIGEMENEDIIHDICIVGIGISGLSTTISLLKKSKLLSSSSNSPLRILLCERDEHLHNRRQGYGLTLTNSLNGPLAQLGILDKCLERNCLSRSHFTFTRSGSILGYYGRIAKDLSEKDKITQPSGGSRGNIRIPREELRNIMLQEVITLSNDPQQTLRQLPSFESKLDNKSSDSILSSANEKSFADYATSSSYHHLKGTDYADLQESAAPRDHIQFRWGYKFLYYEENNEYITCYFEVSNGKNKTIKAIKATVLLGCDGIKSNVRTCRDYCLNYQSIAPLNYLGVTVMIGISEFYHPLVYEKGFYVLDGEHRLFIMPYYTPNTSMSDVEAKAEAVGLVDRPEKPLIMWQLSFSGVSETESIELRKLSFEQSIEYAKSHIKGWFPPIQELIESTLSNEVWITPLYDRNEMKIQEKYQENYELFHQRKKKEQTSPPEERNVYLERMEPRHNTRVTVLGDACHPMSMFKGQGANQSLEDGILFAEYILGEKTQQVPQKRKNKNGNNNAPDEKQIHKKMKRTNGEAKERGDTDVKESRAEPRGLNESNSSICSLPKEMVYHRIRHFEREMLSKTFPKVLASRQAAKDLHSIALQELLESNQRFDEFENAVKEFKAFSLSDYLYTINGIKDNKVVEEILKECYDEKISALLNENLENKFQEIILKYYNQSKHVFK